MNYHCLTSRLKIENLNFNRTEYSDDDKRYYFCDIVEKAKKNAKKFSIPVTRLLKTVAEIAP